MAASAASVDSHHAEDNPANGTCIALISYNLGINNKEVLNKAWQKGPKRKKLKADIENIFSHANGIQGALLCEFGSMLEKLSKDIAKAVFESIIAELHLTDIQVYANPPYVALIHTTYWRVETCLLVPGLCDATYLIVQHLILQHMETHVRIQCFNAHIPTSITKKGNRKKLACKVCVKSRHSSAVKYQG